MVGFRRDATGLAHLGTTPLDALLELAGVSTPAYCYDLDAVAATAEELKRAFDRPRTLVAYAVKANTAGSVLRRLARLGVGADVVAGAELQVALGCGIPPDRILMSGVAKTDLEIDAALRHRIRALQVESVEELGRIAARAEALGVSGRVALRVNPGVEIDSHAHVATGHDEAKFGIGRADLPGAISKVVGHARLELVGLSMHVGSMLRDPGPWIAAGRVVAEEARALRARGMPLEYVDLGGGFGIDYGGAPCAEFQRFAEAARELFAEYDLEGLDLVIEPGRALVAAHGVLVARVVQRKESGHRRWVMIDAGMNDLVRPALYGARHRVEPVGRAPGGRTWRVVGPVCESSDDFGEHALGEDPEGLVVIRDAGAYGFVMASEYNGRALPSEVFLGEGQLTVSPSAGADAWVRRRLQA